MSDLLPMAAAESFTNVTHQGKTLQVGDPVVVHHAGARTTVTVSSIIKKEGHYWVGYHADAHFCPWPLVSLSR